MLSYNGIIHGGLAFLMYFGEMSPVNLGVIVVHSFPQKLRYNRTTQLMIPRGLAGVSQTVVADGQQTKHVVTTV